MTLLRPLLLVIAVFGLIFARIAMGDDDFGGDDGRWCGNKETPESKRYVNECSGCHMAY